MVVTMRLYRLHDMDLLYLYKMPNTSIQKIIKMVLKIYVQDRDKISGISQRISIPRLKFPFQSPKSALLHICLDDKQDKEVIDWIQQIPKGVRNALLKNILRSYIDFPITIPYETQLAEAVREQQLPIETPKPKKKKKKHKKQKTADEILEKPLHSETTIVDKQLSTTANTILEKGTQYETEPISQTKENLPTEDLFDDFESMMKDF